MRLTGPSDQGAKPASDEKPAVFISASVADAGWEDAVHDAFERRGYEVLTASDLSAGVPPEAAINSAPDKATTVVGIFSDKSGPWAEREVVKAMEKDVSVVPLAVGPRAKIPAGLRRTEAVHISDPGDVDAAIGQIVDKLA